MNVTGEAALLPSSFEFLALRRLTGRKEAPPGNPVGGPMSDNLEAQGAGHDRAALPAVAVETGRVESGEQTLDPERLSDEELIKTMRRFPAQAEACREVLFRRAHPKVAAWCVRISGGHQEAADLAQDVLLRVHEHLEGFRLESRFSTWLYTVTRSVAINRCRAGLRRAAVSIDEEGFPEPTDLARDPEETVEVEEILARFRRAMREDLGPLEAKVLYLHFVSGLTLAAITDLLSLDNRSGAKAYVVSGKRKLGRRFGRWLSRQSDAQPTASTTRNER